MYIVEYEPMINKLKCSISYKKTILYIYIYIIGGSFTT